MFHTEEIRKDLEKAIEYYIEYADIEELKEQCKWYLKGYGANNLYCLKNAIYQSYLENFNEKELKEKIKELYEV